MARDSKDKSKERLDKIFGPTLSLQIFDAQGQETRYLTIANMLDGSLRDGAPIGIRKNEKNYLYDLEKAKNEILFLISKGISLQQATNQVYNHMPIKGEMPQNYSEAYTYNGKGEIFSVAKLEPVKSSDKFTIEINDPTLQGEKNIRVKLKTHNPQNPHSPYQEDVTVILNEDPDSPGLFLSKPLLLVSKKIFDQDSIQGQDNSLNDQTFLSELEGEVTITYQGKSGEMYSISAGVAVEKILPIQPIIFENEEGNKMADHADVNRQLLFAQETLASAGIKIQSLDPIYLKLPQDVTLKDGLTEAEVIRLAEYTYPQTPKKGLRVIFAGDQLPKRKDNTVRSGLSITDMTGLAPEVRGTVFLSTQGGPAETAGHEFAHCLIDSVKDVNYQQLGLDRSGHHFNYLDLLYSSPSGKGLFSSQHLTKEQIQVIQQSPLLINSSSYRTSHEYQEGWRFVPGS